MRLAVEMEIAVCNCSYYHKYTLGTELRQAALPNVGADLTALRNARAIADCSANPATTRRYKRSIVFRGANAVATPSRRLPPESNTATAAVSANQHFFSRNTVMKSPTTRVACLAITAAIACVPESNAQTCTARVRASNPTDVYVIDTVNGTVTDTRTGLMWDRCPRGQSDAACGTGPATTFSWAQAMSLPATLGSYKGYSDWRLPNIKELRSLVEECRINPSINEFAFPATPASFFWSGSPGVADATSARSVYFYYGYVSDGTRGDVYRVRLVRAGQ
jgi:Protein of unknown function (DUF1566)